MELFTTEEQEVAKADTILRIQERGKERWLMIHL